MTGEVMMATKIGSRTVLLSTLVVLINFCVLCSGNALSAELSAKISPDVPAIGEPFYLVVEAEAEGDEEPYISFEKGQAEVISKSREGVTIQSQFINGRIVVKKTLRYRYELTASRPGTIRISNITATFENKVLKASDVSFNVVAKRKEADDIFLVAEVSNNNPYVGEGVDVNYYIYYRVSISNPEVKEYPKLNGFIKRFHMPDETSERVQYDGKLFYRSLKYSARVYPEKEGTYFIDSLKISLHYQHHQSNSPFGGAFGFAMGQYRSKTIQNDKVEIKVKELPTENFPKEGFTGLVGVHTFKLNFDRNRYLENEAIEMKLEVQGPGALEKMEDPILYSSSLLENFDTQAELNELDNKNAKKTFLFTMLGRGEVNIPKSIKKLYYFDPASAKYVAVQIEIPELIVTKVVGANTKSNTSSYQPTEGRKEDRQTQPYEVKKSEFLAPIFESRQKINHLSLNNINMLLLGTLLLFVLGGTILNWRASANSYQGIARVLRKKELSYFEFVNLLNELSPGAQTSLGAIQNLNIAPTSKNKLKLVLKNLEKTSFDLNGDGSRVRLDKSLIVELKNVGNQHGNKLT